jgi:hypothetical protein
MMDLPENEIVVLDIAGAYARVVCCNQGDEANLAKFGFVSENGQMVCPISDVADRQKLVNALIALGALFSGGRDWSPAELVDFYREQGVIATGYRMITWKSPHQYIVIDRR